MHLPTVLGAVFTAHIGTALAAPLSAIQMGSKHTLYLATCTTRSLIPGCPLIILCPRSSAPSDSSTSAAQTYKAAAYFANPLSSSNDNPSDIVTISERGEPWEGAQRAARLNKKSFVSNIDAAAAGLATSEIAGTAVLGDENFVCFKDGGSRFEEDGGLLGIGGQSADCTAEYFCASVS
jgi:hypothetical protein